MNKIIEIVDFPFKWIRKVTIPPCEKEDYDNILVVIWPFFGLLVSGMIITSSIPNNWYWLGLVPLALIWSCCYYFLVKERFKAPKGYAFIELIGMTCGFIQTYYVSGILIDMLTMIGVITKLSTTYLALTIIAVGNALPDAFLTIKLAGRGKAMMGIIGGYAG